MSFKRKMLKFMQGRYGADELYIFLVKLYIIIFLVNLFTRSIFLDILLLFVVVFMIYRFFSKKIYARSRENQKFLQVKKMIMKPFTIIKMNFKDKNHIYKKCRKCKTILKLPLPSKRGIKSARCPGCGSKVKIFSLKKEKITVITDKNKMYKANHQT